MISHFILVICLLTTAHARPMAQRGGSPGGGRGGGGGPPGGGSPGGGSPGGGSSGDNNQRGGGYPPYTTTSSATKTASSTLSCQENIMLTVTPTATNVPIPPTFNISAITAANISTYENTTFGPVSQPMSGTYAISARYCAPQVYNASRANTLQLLVHGIAYDKNYWSGLGPPGQQPYGTSYSWVDYASQQGYPTLSIDRLCNGNSSKPNATSVCQIPMNAAVIHGVIQAASQGTTYGGRTWSRIVYVGHSTGSVVANYLAQLWPDDVDAYILTGFTAQEKVGALGTLVATGARPASGVTGGPTFAAPANDAAYLAETNATGTRGVLYAGLYESAVAAYDFAHRGTLTVGEVATSYLGQGVASGFTGPVYALNGARDQIFCARDVYDPIQGNRGDCGSGDSSYTAQVEDLYPNAASFAYYNTVSTGHDVNLHLTSSASFANAFQWLRSVGF